MNKSSGRVGSSRAGRRVDLLNGRALHEGEKCKSRQAGRQRTMDESGAPSTEAKDLLIRRGALSSEPACLTYGSDLSSTRRCGHSTRSCWPQSPRTVHTTHSHDTTHHHGIAHPPFLLVQQGVQGHTRTAHTCFSGRLCPSPSHLDEDAAGLHSEVLADQLGQRRGHPGIRVGTNPPCTMPWSTKQRVQAHQACAPALVPQAVVRLQVGE